MCYTIDYVYTVNGYTYYVFKAMPKVLHIYRKAHCIQENRANMKIVQGLKVSFVLCNRLTTKKSFLKNTTFEIKFIHTGFS